MVLDCIDSSSLPSSLILDLFEWWLKSMHISPWAFIRGFYSCGLSSGDTGLNYEQGYHLYPIIVFTRSLDSDNTVHMLILARASIVRK